MKRIPSLLLGLLWVLACPASAEIYQWKDENGKVHFGDNKPGHTEFETVEAEATNEISLTDNKVKAIDKTPEDFYKRLERQPKSSNEKLKASSEYHYYDIYVWSEKDIVPAAFRTSPITENGKKLVGHTKWDVRWNFQMTKLENNVCMLKSHDITAKITYRMPRLVTQNMDKKTADAVQKNWQEFYTALMEHEDGHMENGLAAANEINKFLSGVYGEKYNCPSFSAGMDKYPKEIVEFYNERDEEYDKTTQHGMTQGADISGYF